MPAVVGNFNGWTPGAHVLRRRSNGTRSVSVTVPTGSSVHFRYLGENGLWFDDPGRSRHHRHRRRGPATPADLAVGRSDTSSLSTLSLRLDGRPTLFSMHHLVLSGTDRPE